MQGDALSHTMCMCCANSVLCQCKRRSWVVASVVASRRPDCQFRRLIRIRQMLASHSCQKCAYEEEKLLGKVARRVLAIKVCLALHAV